MTLQQSALPAPVALVIENQAVTLGLSALCRRRLEAKVAARLARGDVSRPVHYAKVAAWHEAVSAHRAQEASVRDAAREAARSARDAERAVADAANMARVALLRAEYVAAMARLSGTSRLRAEIALARKFDGASDEALADHFGGASRACRDQWVRRGAKSVIALGVSSELAAYITRGA